MRVVQLGIIWPVGSITPLMALKFANNPAIHKEST